MDEIEKTVIITSFAHDLSVLHFANLDKIGEVEEAETLKEWLLNGVRLKLTLTKA